MKKKSVLIVISLLILGGYGFGIQANPELGTSLITATIVNFNTQLGQSQINPRDKAQIVQGFCKTLSPQTTTGFSTLYEQYDASQSLFLYILCKNTPIQTSFFQPQLAEYLKTSSFISLKMNKNCQKNYQESCNIVELSEQLMIQLFSELFTMKQAEIFGLSQPHLLNKSLLTQKINHFAKEKFGIEKFCDDPNHKYPNTCSNMEKTMKAFIPKLSKFKLINSEKLYQLAKDKKSNESLKECINSYDFLLCGLLGESNEGLRPFTTLLYNELARYTIFMTSYTNSLNQRDSFSTPIKNEIAQYEDHQKKLLFLTNQTLDDLLALARSYPIHIGLLAYQEDLLRFRNKALSKIITPFYTLYHKLRNVQSDS